MTATPLLRFPVASPPQYPGAQLTGDLNLSLPGVATMFQGAVAPTLSGLGVSSLAGIWWHDISGLPATSQIKLRTQDDTAWVLIGTLNEVTGTFFTAGIAGVTRIPTEDYTVLAGDGYLMVDLTDIADPGNLNIILTDLSEDTDVIIKDLYSLATGTRTISALGTVDGKVNPILVQVEDGWTRLKFTFSLLKWSLIG